MGKALLITKLTGLHVKGASQPRRRRSIAALCSSSSPKSLPNTGHYIQLQRSSSNKAPASIGYYCGSVDILTKVACLRPNPHVDEDDDPLDTRHPPSPKAIISPQTLLDHLGIIPTPATPPGSPPIVRVSTAPPAMLETRVVMRRKSKPEKSMAAATAEVPVYEDESSFTSDDHLFSSFERGRMSHSSTYNSSAEFKVIDLCQAPLKEVTVGKSMVSKAIMKDGSANANHGVTILTPISSFTEDHIITTSTNRPNQKTSIMPLKQWESFVQVTHQEPAAENLHKEDVSQSLTHEDDNSPIEVRINSVTRRVVSKEVETTPECQTPSSQVMMTQHGSRRKTWRTYSSRRRGVSVAGLGKNNEIQERWRLREKKIEWQSEDEGFSSYCTTPNKSIGGDGVDTNTSIRRQGDGLPLSESTVNDDNEAEEGLRMMNERSVAIVKCSSEPFMDFRDSMIQMIFERQMFSAAELEELLQCFLSLNSEEHHATIIQAFTEVWEQVFDHKSYSITPRTRSTFNNSPLQTPPQTSLH